MPSKAPAVGDILAAKLVALGRDVRAHRERQKVTATAAAEAAGISRVTLHRIERGEPSVTMGAYLSAIAAVGLEIELVDSVASKSGRPASSVPSVIRLDQYPQLERLAWQLQGATEVTAAEALNLYERNWRHIDQRNMEPRERVLVQSLADTHGGGRLLV